MMCLHEDKPLRAAEDLLLDSQELNGMFEAKLWSAEPIFLSHHSTDGLKGKFLFLIQTSTFFQIHPVFSSRCIKFGKRIFTC